MRFTLELNDWRPSWQRRFTRVHRYHSVFGRMVRGFAIALGPLRVELLIKA